MTLSARHRRVTLALHQDVNERVHQMAALVGQNPNYFVNQCVAGVLNAMDSEEIVTNILIVTIVRKVLGKPVLDAKHVPPICALFAPPAMKLTPRHFQHFAELIHRHEGRLTREAVELYWKQADDLCQQRTKFEQELAALNESSAAGEKS